MGRKPLSEKEATQRDTKWNVIRKGYYINNRTPTLYIYVQNVETIGLLLQMKYGRVKVNLVVVLLL